MDEPLIWTTKGNLPCSSLEYRQYWLEDENSIACCEDYFLDGELVKSNRHVKLKKGLDFSTELGAFHG